MMSSRLPGTAGLLVVGVLSTVLCACGREAPPAASLAQPVRVMNVTESAGGPTIVATGLVRAASEAPLAFKTPGIIADLKVVAGQSVSAGQALAALVTTDLDAQLTQARENLAKTERDLARAESLRGKGMISQQAEQDVRAQREVAQAALAAATFNRQQAVISAPAAGVILEKRADARETVAAGQPVVILGRLDRGWVVKAGLPARDALQLKVGDLVQVTLDTAGKEASPIAAKVARIGAASDARTGTIEVEASLPAGTPRLVSGMVARLDFLTQANKRVITLPLSAVLEGNRGKAHVFLLEPGEPATGVSKVKRIEVTTGQLHDGSIEIVAGLPANATVVSEGAAWLNDGDSVRVLK